MALPSAALPSPSLTFTIPSLHDGLPLDCRIYHPASLGAVPDGTPWRKHAAIFAHPYAPLGGCYDDPVVDMVAGTLLQLGFLVGTFNFRCGLSFILQGLPLQREIVLTDTRIIRGAHGSAGRTSWTAKAERADYMSVVGFVCHYVHFLDPFNASASSRVEGTYEDEDGTDLRADGGEACPIRIRPATPTSSEPTTRDIVPILLLGGYSYGSMIASQLPSLETILGLFHAPGCGTPAAEIRLRAQYLAGKQNVVLASAREAAAVASRPKSPRIHVGLRVGGDEERRVSHESRRSRSTEFEEAIRHGVAELVARTKKGHRLSLNERGQAPTASVGGGNAVADHLLPIADRTSFVPAYLLVSPLQGFVTNLATMSLPPLFSLSGRAWSRFATGGGKEPVSSGPSGPDTLPRAVLGEAEDKLVKNATLAIYGDRDGFVPVRKLRNWASRLQAIQHSKFRAHEVSSADHFWAQRNVVSTLREAVRAFAISLIQGTAG
ncbi:hypothetical protein MYCTH_2308987 [Thermothelomyces thermophilus ATCC 42464]|uniref:AB hydrolase-1 domain-containing protein n=1 Tax=Thermothelomyces thermophilus (strain ATCC 42464 / BCRC 31852 / DSM 1799) TaxID=573729 RepID=G2QKK9_THET4|nr:uncharacterized protein MYCTH_2308987 [Thermothelomyces thermophilus ATCC 42464]AEO60115.1 hypothetical protein MYCTH_2308987 [Thermothelomyces thermophilus ATCC 42464]